MSRYVALLRGINVGGKNLIKMTDLKTCFERQGFTKVATYIQSGNVVFKSTEGGGVKLGRRIEKALAGTFGYDVKVVVRSKQQMQGIVTRAPDRFGSQPGRYRYDVIFLKEPLTASTAMQSVLTRPGVDQAHAGVGVLYFTRLTSRAAQSRLTKLITLPVYQDMTIRNWNTTTRLLAMMLSDNR